MTSNDNTAAQTLLFPIQERRVDECDTAHEMIMACKLTWANTLNRIRAGQKILSEFEKERYKQSLNEINPIFIKYGYSPLNFDFF